MKWAQERPMRRGGEGKGKPQLSTLRWIWRSQSGPSHPPAPTEGPGGAVRAELSPRGCAELVSTARMGAEQGGCSWPWALSSLPGRQTFKTSLLDFTSVQTRTRFYSHWTGNSDPLPAGVLTSGRGRGPHCDQHFLLCDLSNLINFLS